MHFLHNFYANPQKDRPKASRSNRFSQKNRQNPHPPEPLPPPELHQPGIGMGFHGTRHGISWERRNHPQDSPSNPPPLHCKAPAHNTLILKTLTKTQHPNATPGASPKILYLHRVAAFRSAPSGRQTASGVFSHWTRKAFCDDAHRAKGALSLGLVRKFCPRKQRITRTKKEQTLSTGCGKLVFSFTFNSLNGEYEVTT